MLVPSPSYCTFTCQPSLLSAPNATDLDLETPPWPSVSRHAKDLVRRMLQVGRQGWGIS